MKNNFAKNEYTDDLREAIKELGGQKAVSERFKIPYRTVQNWARGMRHPPEYVAIMLIDHAQEKVIHESCMEDAYTKYQEALAGNEDKHSMSTEDEEIEMLKNQNQMLRNQNEVLKNQKETLWNQYEVLQKQFNTMFEIAEKRHAAIGELEKALDEKIEELERERRARATWARQAGTLTK